MLGHVGPGDELLDGRSVRLLDERDLVGRRREVRPAIERIDPLRVPKADPPQHLLDAARLRTDLPDHLLRLLRQERGVDRPLREEAADELLVLLREEIRLGVREPREVPPERVPQVRRPVRLERGQELREDLVAKRVAVHLDEEEADVRKEEPDALWDLPVLGVEDEAADLRGAIVRVADGERRVLEVPVERGRVTLLVDDVEVDVRRVTSPELGDDHRGADEARRAARVIVVEQDEDVLASLRVLDLLREALLRLVENAADGLAIVRQVHRVEVMRDLEERVLVRGDCAADFVGKHAPCEGLPR